MKAHPADIACYAASTREAQLFRQATGRVKDTQERLLLKLLQKNAGTVYGKRYAFNGIRSSDAYRERVPLVDYEAIAEHMQRISAGEEDILFRGRALCMQPTSGTSAASKLIPFTAGLKRDYQRAVATWIFDLQSHLPTLLQGKAYWSLSPSLSENVLTSAGIPVGFLDDSQYLPPAMGTLFRSTFAVPSEVGLIRDTELFRYLTMAFLLKASELTFVSIWNPTFFMLLLESFRENGTALADDIERGVPGCLGDLPEHIREKIARAFSGAMPGRAAEIRKLRAECQATGEALYPRLWPNLALISCWEHGEAATPALRLRELFPGVTVQPKGLLATEAAVSIPFLGVPYPLLALRSHFYEFIPLGQDNETCRAWELQEDLLYQVVVTTSGGLYRYRLGDVVRVRGFYHDCPLLEFVGRGRHTSDFYGEKLHQQHVSEVISKLFSNRNPAAWFALLAPDGVNAIERYTLYVACDEAVAPVWLDTLGARFDQALRANFHYDYCRSLGQLQEIQVCRIALDVTAALKRFTEEMKSRGIREGDIKPAVLDNRPVWGKVFQV